MNHPGSLVKAVSDHSNATDIKPTVDGNYFLDHAENCDMKEEDSVDRLWLVVRSLKSPNGREVSITGQN
jgi:hypothetical protein